MFGFDRISSDPNVMGGKAYIRGMRISVSLIVNLAANGMNFDEILDEHPDLELEDIQQALRYAAWAADRFLALDSRASQMPEPVANNPGAGLLSDLIVEDRRLSC